MSNFVGNKPTPLSILLSGAKKIFTKSQKTTGTGAIDSVGVAKNLKKKFDAKQSLFKGVDEKGSGLTTAEKGKFKKEGSKEIDRIFKKYEKKAKGGRIGYKRGTGLKRKSNIQKIKETFGPKQKPQSRMTGKKKFPDMSGDGKITQKDILIAKGVIPKPKKKII